MQRSYNTTPQYIVTMETKISKFLHMLPFHKKLAAFSGSVCGFAPSLPPRTPARPTASLSLPSHSYFIIELDSLTSMHGEI